MYSKESSGLKNTLFSSTCENILLRMKSILPVGAKLGLVVGEVVGREVGAVVGWELKGCWVGEKVEGERVGKKVGNLEGREVEGCVVGSTVGLVVVGLSDGVFSKQRKDFLKHIKPSSLLGVSLNQFELINTWSPKKKKRKHTISSTTYFVKISKQNRPIFLNNLWVWNCEKF